MPAKDHSSLVNMHKPGQPAASSALSRFSWCLGRDSPVQFSLFFLVIDAALDGGMQIALDGEMQIVGSAK